MPDRGAARSALGVCSVLACAACDSEPGLERYMQSLPQPAELVGRWHVPEESLKQLERRRFALTGRERHVIELHASGACLFRSHWQYSYIDGQDPEAASYYDTNRCRWELAPGGARVGATSFDAAAVLLELVEGARRNVAVYYVARLGEHLVLWQSIGEPREGAFMDFRRHSAH